MALELLKQLDKQLAGRLDVAPVVIDVLRRDDAVFLGLLLAVFDGEILAGSLQRVALVGQRKGQRAQVEELAAVRVSVLSVIGLVLACRNLRGRLPCDR